MKDAEKSHKETSNSPPGLIAWHVVERNDKSFWTRIGAAWEHEDQDGFTLQLDLMPITTGRIVLRCRRDDDDKAA